MKQYVNIKPKYFEKMRNTKSGVPRYAILYVQLVNKGNKNYFNFFGISYLVKHLHLYGKPINTKIYDQHISFEATNLNELCDFLNLKLNQYYNNLIKIKEIEYCE